MASPRHTRIISWVHILLVLHLRNVRLLIKFTRKNYVKGPLSIYEHTLHLVETVRQPHLNNFPLWDHQKTDNLAKLVNLLLL